MSVVAFDASPTQVEDLRRGNVDVLIAQHPNDIGDKGVRIAVDYLKSDKEPSSKQITTDFLTVTRENIDDPEVQGTSTRRSARVRKKAASEYVPRKARRLLNCGPWPRRCA